MRNTDVVIDADVDTKTIPKSPAMIPAEIIAVCLGEKAKFKVRIGEAMCQKLNALAIIVPAHK